MPACHAGDRRFESGRVRHPRISLRPVRPPGRGVLLPQAPSPRPPAADLRHLCQTPARDPTPHPDRDRPAPRRRRGGGRRRSVRTRRWRRGRPRRRPPRHPPAARATAAADSDADERPARCRRLGQPVADRPADPGHAGRRSSTCRSCRSRASDRRVTSATAKDVAAVLAGTSSRYEASPSSTARRHAILGALGVADADPPTSSRSPTSRPSPRTWPRTASGWPSCGRTRSGRRCAPWPGAARRCSASIGSRSSPTGR